MWSVEVSRGTQASLPAHQLHQKSHHNITIRLIDHLPSHHSYRDDRKSTAALQTTEVTLKIEQFTFWVVVVIHVYFE